MVDTYGVQRTRLLAVRKITESARMIAEEDIDRPLVYLSGWNNKHKDKETIGKLEREKQCIGVLR